MTPEQRLELSNIVGKITVGDGLTNQELDLAISFYSQLEEALGILGIKFSLARTPILRTLDNLRQQKDWRTIK